MRTKVKLIQQKATAETKHTPAMCAHNHFLLPAIAIEFGQHIKSMEI